MKLLFLGLLVIAFGVVKGDHDNCWGDWNCPPGERCVRLSRRSWWIRGVCKPVLNRCRTGLDCGPNECCESTALLRGRKKRQIGGREGVCKPLQSTGDKCYIQYDSGKPRLTVLLCPCTSDLTCLPDGGRDIPQGYTGVCGKSKSCRSGADCGPNECCESTAQLKGRKKRQIGGIDGICKPLQSNGKGCLIQYPAGKPSTTVLQCPCRERLHCSPDGGRTVPQGYTGVCGVPVSCRTGADCNPHECCKSRFRPIGRKKRQVEGGVCDAMGTPGANCFTRYRPGKPKRIVFACPCKLGFTCRGSGLFDIPLGETGTCG